MKKDGVHITRDGSHLLLHYGPGPLAGYVITHDGPGSAIRLTLAALRAGVAVSYRDVRDALEVA